jgi:hypothetical protein
VFEVAQEDERMVVLLGSENEEAFDAVRNDPSVREMMRSNGTVGAPEFTVLRKIEEFPS